LECIILLLHDMCASRPQFYIQYIATSLFWTKMDLQFCVLQPQSFSGEAELQVCRLWDEGGTRICQQISLLWISWPLLLHWLPYKPACHHSREGAYQVGLHTVGACCRDLYNTGDPCYMPFHCLRFHFRIMNVSILSAAAVEAVAQAYRVARTISLTFRTIFTQSRNVMQMISLV
jgi:hypothetical protein